MSIDAKSVKELRERTQLAIMDCKKALQETNGDIEAAVAHLKKMGVMKADKKSSKTAAEGVCTFASNGARGVLVEVNCQTDFVGGGDEFKAFGQAVADLALEQSVNDVEALASLTMKDQATVDEMRLDLIARMGENIQIRRMTAMTAQGHLFGYSHGGKIVTLVDISADNQTLGKDLAMHVAASAPLALTVDNIPSDALEGESEESKEDLALLTQSFVKDPSFTVAQYLEQHETTLHAFHRVVLGEGIEKEEVDFAGEVMAQVKESKDV